MECFAGRAFNIKNSKSMNGPSRVKRLPSNGKRLGCWHLYGKLMHHKLGLYFLFSKNILSKKKGITYRKGILWIKLRIGIRLRVLVSRGRRWGCNINSKGRKEASRGGRSNRRGRKKVNSKCRGRGNRCR